MSRESRDSSPHPYVATCAFCEQGLLRVWIVGGSPVALCDECELYWDDIAGVSADPETKPAGSYPDGPCGHDSRDDWSPAGREKIEKLGLKKFIIGESV